MSSLSYNLNKAIWNASLYKRVRDVWFGSLPLGAITTTPEIQDQWFGRSEEKKAAFDKVCVDEMSHVLESIGPKHYPLKERSTEAFVATFAQELQSPDAQENSQTALSLIVLLDQIPRNLYRTPETLPLVYQFYDPLALALAKHVQTLSPRPDLHSSIRRSNPYRMWFYLPLMHSENVEDHKLFDGIMKEFSAELVAGKEEIALQEVENFTKFEAMHRKIIDRWGRYPHRNAAAGRETTKEEREWLESGGATFGVAKSG
ncbi:hypothetical protein FKW77_001084 [Venturia effusa]|uniref:DUF924-domain-containing protein n=1 Tax=Venturia effusa TaxID=50376 RepID=A0A517L0R2_9PEZI|nr:hypothetical protein FKW77_001084 [Venturia effusa]